MNSGQKHVESAPSCSRLLFTCKYHIPLRELDKSSNLKIQSFHFTQQILKVNVFFAFEVSFKVEVYILLHQFLLSSLEIL